MKSGRLPYGWRPLFIAGSGEKAPTHFGKIRTIHSVLFCPHMPQIQIGQAQKETLLSEAPPPNDILSQNRSFFFRRMAMTAIRPAVMTSGNHQK